MSHHLGQHEASSINPLNAMNYKTCHLFFVYKIPLFTKYRDILGIIQVCSNYPSPIQLSIRHSTIIYRSGSYNYHDIYK